MSTEIPEPSDGPTPVAQLESAAMEVVRQLAASGDPEAFQALLRLSGTVGESLGISARNVAAASSWTAVAGAAGTSRQAAWSRWKA
ncbi:hypothetical protein VVR84_04765 [Kocuria carniphila]|uniref:ANTAR domain-containing protein n=1 Tax=Kocuria carniphila TaxID=262208 RepID=A0ABV3V2J9_9MICC|nr:hypothetical protein [Kocuria carniphila]MCT1803768.1 hypothetical protein [Kocuria carniphila]PZP34324.1 MAG: hypothetical protein DI613_05785 [Kocuria rhizophila]